MKRFDLVLATTLALSACSSSDKDQGTPPSTGTPNDVDLTPPDPGKGVQLQMVSQLGAGQEIERCRFFVAPPEGYFVNRQEVRFTAGSHHVLLYTTPYTAIPHQDRFGTDVDTSGVFDCGKQGPTAHWSIDGVAGGSQTAKGPPIVDHLPADTAVKIPGGTVLLMNTHYLNATAQTMMTDARINLYTVPGDQVRQEAGFVFFYNPFIRVPALGRSEAQEVCPVLSDVSLVNAQNHMHKRGVGYLATLMDQQGMPIDELYRGTEWAEVVMRRNDPPKLLKAGQLIDYKCEYANHEDRVVTQGLATTDEMCMFVGLYYPRNRRFELCGANDQWEGAFIGAQWVGSGTKGGLETAGCFMGSKDTSEDKGDSFYGCVVDSCPRIAKETSNVARCLATRGFGQCEEACKTGGAACKGCFAPRCQDAFMALAAAKCE